MSVEFCDTNILVYANDLTAGRKRAQAQELLARLWGTMEGAISIQVMQEFYAVITRKVPSMRPPSEARDAIYAYSAWKVVEPKKGDILEAIDLSQHRQLSFWDAMLVVAAQRVDATILWTEGLSHGQTFGGVTIRNPFRV